MDTSFSNTSDICQQLLDRYGNSSAPQHRHLCATAAATRSLIQSESLPLTPFSYFAAAISTLSDQNPQLDPNAFAAVSSFLTIVLPLLPENAIAPDKAEDAVGVVVGKINSDVNEASLGNASVRALVKSLGTLLGFCNLEDWDSIKLGFNILLKFSIDKRPKVRKCAQDRFVALFKSLKSSAVIKDASKSVYSLLKDQMPLASSKISGLEAPDGCKVELMSKPECQELVHLLNVLKIIVPHLSVKVCSKKVLPLLMKLLTTEFAALSKHIFEIIQAMIETSKVEVIASDLEKVIKYLVAYISLKEKNPLDAVLSAATLSKQAVDSLHASNMTEWISLLPLVISAVAGLLSSEGGTALQASNILKDLIDQHVDKKLVIATDGQLEDDTGLRAVKSICEVFENLLKDGVVPNEYLLGVISVLFMKLGEFSVIYMKSILLKLAEMMNFSSIGAAVRENVSQNLSESSYEVSSVPTPSFQEMLQKCIGSAVVAMGAEKFLVLLPVSLNSTDYSCSNIWVLPILKEYTVGSSLQFFMQHFVTLANSLRRESEKARKPEVSKNLEAYANNCWELLPAFCHYPTDTYKNFGSLAKLLVPFINDSPMLENIAASLQELVNQNKQVLASDDFPGAKLPETEYILKGLRSKLSYSKKIAKKNIRALASCSGELLQTLVDVFLELPSDRHESLKDAIGCLVSISDPSMIKSIFFNSLKRLQLIKDLGDSGELEFLSGENKESDETTHEKDVNRCLVLKLASCFVDGACEGLVNVLFKVTCHVLEVMEGIGPPEAYQTLNSILEKHSAFASTQFVRVMDLLVKLKSPSDITSLKSRFKCLQILLIHALKENHDEEENINAFLILNEIILALKASDEESRKAAYDILTEINASLRKISYSTSEELHQKLITLVMGYLEHSSPKIKSGAVSALSVLVYSDNDICFSMPELIPSILGLLQMKKKTIEVIKAILGFAKVLVSSLQAKELQNFLPDIVNGILPWSSMSRNHFRSKVTVIMEIITRKCGVASVKSLVPQKYRDFLQNVLENRHGKTSSNETGTGSVAEPKPSDSSPRGWKRKKPKESTNLPEERSNTSRKRPREKRSKGFVHSTAINPPKSSDTQKLVKRKEDWQKQKSQRQGRGERESVSKTGGKRKMHWAETNNKNKGYSQNPAAELAKIKRVRVGKKRSKVEK